MYVFFLSHLQCVAVCAAVCVAGRVAVCCSVHRHVKVYRHVASIYVCVYLCMYICDLCIFEYLGIFDGAKIPERQLIIKQVHASIFGVDLVARL